MLPTVCIVVRIENAREPGVRSEDVERWESAVQAGENRGGTRAVEIDQDHAPTRSPSHACGEEIGEPKADGLACIANIQEEELSLTGCLWLMHLRQALG